MNVVLVRCERESLAALTLSLSSRDQKKLDESAKAIREKYSKVEVRTLAVDFKNPDYEKWVCCVGLRALNRFSFAGLLRV